MALPVIGFAGMTHLGINSAVASAERGFEIICFDPDQTRIVPLTEGELPVVEPDLPELLAKNKSRLTFTAASEALKRCDVVYVAPDVPTDDTGSSDLGPIRQLIDIVDKAMRPDAVMVILSQVPPGFTRGLARPEAVRYGQVETLIFGRAVERALHPERFILGCADSAQPLPDPWRRYLEAFGCPLLPMRYESAELAKISINMCLVASVTTANTLAELCEGIGADWSEISPALKLDRRIGLYSYLSPGLGIAGGNLERDLATVVRFGDSLGTDVRLVRAYQDNSRHRRHWALRTLHSTVLATVRDPVIGLLGLAYKEDTASTKNSPSLALLDAIQPYRVQAFDPVVKADPAWHPRLTQAASPLAACDGADVLVIMTPWKEFRARRPAEFAPRLRGRHLIDPYAVLDGRACRDAGLTYHRLGQAV